MQCVSCPQVALKACIDETHAWQGGQGVEGWMCPLCVQLREAAGKRLEELRVKKMEQAEKWVAFGGRGSLGELLEGRRVCDGAPAAVLWL